RVTESASLWHNWRRFYRMTQCFVAFIVLSTILPSAILTDCCPADTAPSRVIGDSPLHPFPFWVALFVV
ncbi:MAG: hypothetical protein KDE24_28735, partial [Caldilinea sp.]|nr:hypothetical protein [Caldilinea sp.]